MWVFEKFFVFFAQSCCSPNLKMLTAWHNWDIHFVVKSKIDSENRVLYFQQPPVNLCGSKCFEQIFSVKKNICKSFGLSWFKFELFKPLNGIISRIYLWRFNIASSCKTIKVKKMFFFHEDASFFHHVVFFFLLNHFEFGIAIAKLPKTLWRPCFLQSRSSSFGIEIEGLIIIVFFLF